MRWLRCALLVIAELRNRGPSPSRRRNAPVAPPSPSGGRGIRTERGDKGAGLDGVKAIGGTTQGRLTKLTSDGGRVPAAQVCIPAVRGSAAAFIIRVRSTSARKVGGELATTAIAWPVAGLT